MKRFLFITIMLLIFLSLPAQTLMTNSKDANTPQNLTIQISNGNVLLSWDEVSGALSYVIYASDYPDRNFINISSTGTFNNNSWTGTIPNADKKFYYVKSILENQLDIEIQDNNVTLRWNSNGDAYMADVFASEHIDGPYTNVSDDGFFGEDSWTEPLTNYDHRFYYVELASEIGPTENTEKVGYKRYVCNTTNTTDLNFIAIPFSNGILNASEFAEQIGDIDAISKWNNQKQCWESANDAGYKWLNDFQLQDGYPYMINITTPKTIYIAGKIIQQPIYNLITTLTTDLNAIMLPMDKENLNTAELLGNDIDSCDAVSEFNSSTQQWNSAGNGPFGWANNFSIQIGQALFVNIQSNTTWPNDKK